MTVEYVSGKKFYRLADHPVQLVKAADEGRADGRVGDYEIAVCSDKGTKRSTNEDSFGVSLLEGIVAVADGMGGHLCGEEAAAITIDSLIQHSPSLKMFGRIIFSDKIIKDSWRKSVYAPGAAVAALQIGDRGIIRPTYAGDVRIYVFDGNGTLQYISKDQSDLQRMWSGGQEVDEFNYPHRNVLTYAVGTSLPSQEEATAVCDVAAMDGLGVLGHIKQGNWQKKDVVHLSPEWKWIIATDGLHEYVRHQDILREVKEKTNMRDLVEGLVTRANYGGKDNVTVAAGVYRPPTDATPPTARMIVNVRTPARTQVISPQSP